MKEKLESKGYSHLVKIDWDRVPLYKAYSLLQDGHSLSDIFSVKIVTDSTIDCYSFLGILHRLFKPIEGQFEDNIAIQQSPFTKHLKTKILMNNSEVKVTIHTQGDWELNEKGIFSLLKGELSKEEIRNLSLAVLRNSVHAIKPSRLAPLNFMSWLHMSYFKEK
jgi:GTP diphosphokinase / guanosine-3',5'-bis(diphosphate) 3'-diphosphatase